MPTSAALQLNTENPERYVLPKEMAFPASLQPTFGAAQVLSTLSPLCLGVIVDSQDSPADSWVYFIQGTFCTCGVSLYM